MKKASSQVDFKVALLCKTVDDDFWRLEPLTRNIQVQLEDLEILTVDKKQLL
jgi:hypothetical protein